MTQKVFKIFIDFDGTITQMDVGDSLFREFGDKLIVNNIIDNLISDKITAKQCWTELCRTTYNFTVDTFNNFIDSIQVDPGLHNLVNFCESRKVELIVLSDGFDYYIDRILYRENLTRLKYYSNHLEIFPPNRLVPLFPYHDPYCRTSANCKRNHIINNSSDEDYTIYIGDGNSDKDPALFCDFIFAKKSLLKFCEKERVSFSPYTTFDDIVKKLDELLKKKNLKKRHQAGLKRRQAYISE
jgi:2,3-diketo-5-methylthio-1-phosphopentane phosphatase